MVKLSIIYIYKKKKKIKYIKKKKKKWIKNKIYIIYYIYKLFVLLSSVNI